MLTTVVLAQLIMSTTDFHGDDAVRPAPNPTWTADLGNGTFSNPLFWDEFSDPDMIRVGDDYYLTGTTMHAMPGLPVLHSKDLVNWEFLSYASDRLDYGPAYRLEDGQSIYGQGIWAPCLRYHNGRFYIFTNVNGRKTQIFTSTDPRGPWEHKEMKVGLHDVSVLFDDDDKAYAVWGYRDLHLAQLTDDLTDLVPGTEHQPFGKDAQIGEGSHFYKIGGKYIITSAWYAGRMRMPCARADNVFGPYEVNLEISADEAFGLTSGYRLKNDRNGTFETWPLNPHGGPQGIAMHQGGIVQTQTGEWWGWSMMDSNSVGRLTCLSPVTWSEGWPYFGLPGNLGRTPRIWVKPNTGFKSKPHAPYERSDTFDGQNLKPIWQWNHAPDDTKWSLTERKGFLRLHSLPSPDFWQARNTLTQRGIGPQSTVTVELEGSNLKVGDVAGLALLNYPYTWIGLKKSNTGWRISRFDQTTGHAEDEETESTHVWFRADCDYMKETASLSYSADGKSFKSLGDEFRMVFQLRTFQGIRYALFAFNQDGSPGGWADFAGVTVFELHPSGLTRPIPYGKWVNLVNFKGGTGLAVRGNGLVCDRKPSKFKVVDRLLGRISLQAEDGRFVTVAAEGDSTKVSLQAEGEGQTLQWEEMPRGDVLFLSLVNHRYLNVMPDGTMACREPGAQFDRENGASFRYEVVSNSANNSMQHQETQEP